MKTKNQSLMMCRTKRQLLSWSIALFITGLALVGSAFATPSEDAPIWRVQMRLQTANVSDAGTDDSVRVQLNQANSTWLDYGRDDFPRNNTFTYDLKMDGENVSLGLFGLRAIRDLHFIRISKTGSDGLCLKSFALLVNGREIYTETFPGSGHWLDNDDGDSTIYFVSSGKMRQDNAWLAYTQPFPPFVIPRAEIESRIEGIIGDSMQGNGLQWGHEYGRAYVEVSKKANAVNTLHVDLDLEYAVPHWFNPEVDVDFDLEVRCAGNQITLTVKNLTVAVDSDWYAEVISLGTIQFLDAHLSGQLNQAMKGLKFGNGIDVPFCPVIDVDSDGDINFSLPTPRVVLTKQAAAILASSNAILTQSKASTADNKALLALKVERANEIKADAETAYTLVVKSNREEATNVNLQIALPPLVLTTDGLIEVVDAKGTRLLASQTMPGENGGMRLSFSDRLAANSEQGYRLKLRFLSVPQAELQINATMTEAGSDAMIKSTTFFQQENGAVKAGGTFQATKAVKMVPVANKEMKEQ